jgi:NADPH:quinone reductase-like Zn-dependent oxidoreductase
MIQIQADDAGYKMKLLQFLLQIQFSSQVLIYKLSELEKSKLPPRSTVVSLVEAERPHLATIAENAMRQVKILTGNASRIIWVTSGGLLRCPNPDFALVAGLARTLMLEQPCLSFFNFDVPSEELCSLQTARNIISVLFQDMKRFPEYEIIQDNRTLHVSRFVLDKDANQSFSNALEGQTTFKNLKDASPARFSVSDTRNLTRPVFEASETLQSLEAGYVEVEVGTVGLNSQLFFSSEIQHDTTTLSNIMDFCGVLKHVASDIRTLSPGDRVVVMLPCDLRTHHVVPAWACKVLRDTDSFDIICTVPYTYSSVLYTLKERAHLQAEERILIHQAESFVGQAAIRIAQLAGAEVFVTIPSQLEKDIFVNRYHLDASHIYNYSDKGFITAIAAATQDQGFDVIFSKEALCDIGRLCAPFGRLVHFNCPGRKSRAEELDTTAWNHNVTFITSSFVDVFRHPRQHIRQSILSR